jgi:hypothetical protein
MGPCRETLAVGLRRGLLECYQGNRASLLEFVAVQRRGLIQLVTIN